VSASGVRTTLSRPAKGGLFALAVAAAVLIVVLGWYLWPFAELERPDVYAVTGPQPGDLSANLDLLDNVRNYGIDLDIEYRFRTNSLGFRGPEPPPDPTPTVLVLGDSFAFGMGVSEGETFPDVLRKTLREALPGVAVLNAAVPGYTIADQNEQFQDRLSKLRPKYVIVCHTSSDLKEMARPTSFRRLVAWDDEDPKYADQAVADIVAAYGGSKSEATREVYVFTQKELLKRLGSGSPERLIRWRDDYVAGVLTLQESVENAGGRLVFVSWVDGYGLAGLTSAPVLATLRKSSVLVFDGMKSMISDGSVPAAELFLPDGHLSVAGNYVAGVQTGTWMLSEVIR
jgi:hypothetical protein